MDDIGNLVYLAFVVISLVAGAWSNYRKNKEKESREGPAREVQRPVKSRDDFDEMIERQQKKDKAAERKLAEMEAKALEALSKKNLRKRSQRTIETIELEDETDLTYEFDPREFDARKAIIYSEILNPPYL